MYFYVFKETLPASEVDEQTLNWGNTTMLSYKADEFLPPCTQRSVVTDFVVPWKFTVWDDRGKWIVDGRLQQHEKLIGLCTLLYLKI